MTNVNNSQPKHYKKFCLYSKAQLEKMNEQAGGFVDIQGEQKRDQLHRLEKNITKILKKKKKPRKLPDIPDHLTIQHLKEQVQRILEWFRARENGPVYTPTPVVSQMQPQIATPEPKKIKSVRRPTFPARKKRRSYSEVIAQGATRNLRSKVKGTLPVTWLQLDQPGTSRQSPKRSLEDPSVQTPKRSRRVAKRSSN